MTTLEKYWKSCEKFGFIKSENKGKICYTLPRHLGEGGFEILGDPKGAMACVCDLILFKPMITCEAIYEKTLEFGQLHQGEMNYYKKKSQLFPIEHGLNYYVNFPFQYGYKRTEPNIHIRSVGMFFRERFFSSLPYELPKDFWKSSAKVLNPEALMIPSITQICNEIKNCKLSGSELKMFIHGKALESLAITIDYVYSHKKEYSIYLSNNDLKTLAEVKNTLEIEFVNPPTIKELSKGYLINQQKLTVGFKETYNMTIYNYIKRLRMDKAVELLQNAELLIVEIARLVGYHGDGHFQKNFKEAYGITPSQMRKEILSCLPERNK